MHLHRLGLRYDNAHVQRENSLFAHVLFLNGVTKGEVRLQGQLTTIFRMTRLAYVFRIIFHLPVSIFRQRF